jgi:hypothetical protein
MKKGCIYFSSSVAVFEAASKLMVFSPKLGALKVSRPYEAGKLERVKSLFGGKTPLYVADVEDGLTEEWETILTSKGCWIKRTPEE